MVNKENLFKTLVGAAMERGAFKANVIAADSIVTDKIFREICKSNACGMYGKCYTCPPDAGDIDELIKALSSYEYVLVYQTVSELEDSFDFEGMIEAKKSFYVIPQAMRGVFSDNGITSALHLGAGGCGVCEVCAKRTNEPCRFPDLALSSLEAYGVNVSELAKSAGMKYINGQNTVTYFGAVLFNL